MIGDGKKTVYIDDNTTMLKVISSRLEKLGFIVDTANNAESLFELMKTNNYDIIFLDDMMPAMTGTQAMQKLKKEGFIKPIIVITSNESPADKDRYLDAGFDDYIGKTSINEQLPEVLQKFLK